MAETQEHGTTTATLREHAAQQWWQKHKSTAQQQLPWGNTQHSSDGRNTRARHNNSYLEGTRSTAVMAETQEQGTTTVTLREHAAQQRWQKHKSKAQQQLPWGNTQHSSDGRNTRARHNNNYHERTWYNSYCEGAWYNNSYREGTRSTASPDEDNFSTSMVSLAPIWRIKSGIYYNNGVFIIHPATPWALTEYILTYRQYFLHT